MLNWFVADSGKEVSDRRLVIMICPEIVDNTQDKLGAVKNSQNRVMRVLEENTQVNLYGGTLTSHLPVL